jgi:hypothetical protein
MHELVKPPQGLTLPGCTYLGRGPASTGSRGWPQSAEFRYRCAKCGDVMPGNQSDYYDCRCGAMSLDYDAGRFGSRLGDQNILVYRVTME